MTTPTLLTDALHVEPGKVRKVSLPTNKRQGVTLAVVLSMASSVLHQLITVFVILPFASSLLFWMFTCLCSHVIQHNCACWGLWAIKTVKLWKVLPGTPTHATSWALIQELQLHSVSCSSLSYGGGVLCLALPFSLPSWLLILAWPQACLFTTNLPLYH